MPLSNRGRVRANGRRVTGFTALVALAVGLGTCLASPSWAASPDWNNDVIAGLKQGKDTHKYVLADVYTDWCGWCHRLDKDTFSDEGMVKYLKDKFVCIKVNAEDNGAGQKLAGQYRVSGYPCALVFDQSGKFIGKISGYRDPKGYEAALAQIIANPPSNPMAE